MLNRIDSQPNKAGKSTAKRILSLAGIVMFGLYFVLGIVILFWSGFPLAMDLEYRIMFGLLLIIYSFIRFIRLWKNRVNEIE
jgi:uncharacterized membrane protein (DUF485 family)